MSYTLPELPYSPNSLEPFIDQATMEIHHGKHHQAYIDKLNEALSTHENFFKFPIVELLQDLDSVPEDIRTKVRNNGGGHANHTFFWKIMCPQSQFKMPDGKLLKAINSTFGSLETLQEKFSNAGIARFGSGWVWLIMNNGKLEITDTPNQDTPIMDGKFAILGLDVWEHAYYLKYQNRRADYIKAWWNVVNWPRVSENFKV